MTLFHERERAFESKFAHDAQTYFNTCARRDKLVGLWAAEVLGLTGEDAAAYAEEVVRIDCDEPGHEVVCRKLVADIGHLVDEATIREKLDACMAEAKAQMLEEFVTLP